MPYDKSSPTVGIEDLPVATMLLDSDCRLLAANGPCRDLLGLGDDPASPSANEAWLAIVHPEDLERFRTSIGNLGPKASRAQLECRVSLPETQCRWLLIDATIAHGDANAPDCRVATLTDVTPYRTTTTELQLNRDRLRGFAEAASDWWWETDADHRFVYVSEGGADVAGVPAAQHIGKTRLELSADVANEDMEELWRALAERKPFKDVRYKRRFKDGRLRFVTTSGVPILDEAGRFVGYRGSGRDVTAEMQAGEAHARLLKAIDAARDGIAVWDHDETLVYWNESFARLNPEVSGLLRSGLGAETFFRAETRAGHHFPDFATDDLLRWRLRRFRQGRSCEARLTDGRWIVCRDDLLEGGGHISYRTEITELKRAENANRRYLEAIDELEGHVLLCDAEDRFVACNRYYRDANACAAHLLVPGTPFVEIVRCIIDNSKINIDQSTKEQWIADRVRRRLLDRNSEIHRRDDGTNFLLRDQRLSDGSLLTFGTDITEQVRAEEQLRQSERLFRALIDASPSAITMKDLHGNWVIASAEWQRWTSSREQDLIGKHTSTLFPPEEILRFAEQELLVVEKGIVDTREQTLRLPDGTVREVLTTKFPVTDAEGRMIGVGVINTDITDAHRIAAQNERLAAAIEELDGQIVLWDPDDCLVMCNRFYRDANHLGPNLAQPGTPYADIAKHSLERGLIDTGAATTEEWLQDRYERRALGSSSELQLRDDGRHILFRDQRLRDGSLLSFGTDITDRVLAEKANEQLRAAIETLQVGFELYDPEERLVLFNQTADDLYPNTRFTGETFTRVMTRIVAQGVVPEAEGRTAEWIAERAATFRKPKHTFEIERGGRWYLVNNAKLPDGSTALVSTSIDAQKRSERELARHRDRLEELVAERTAALRQSEAMLDEVAAGVPASIFRRVILADGGSSIPFAAGGLRKSFGLNVISTDKAEPRITDFFTEEQKRHSERLYKKNGQTLTDFTDEYTLNISEKERKTVRVHAVPSRDAAGNIIWNGVMFDVTELKDAERRLREREETLTSIIQNLPGGIYRRVHHHDGRSETTFARGRLYDEALGAKRVDDQGGDLEQLVVPEYRAIRAEGFAAAIRDDTPLDLLFPIVLPDGREIWIRSLAAAPRPAADGTRIVDGIILDVTEQRSAELALVEAMRQNAMLLDTAGDGIFGLDGEGLIRYVNPAATALLDCRAEELTGGSFVALLRSGGADTARADMVDPDGPADGAMDPIAALAATFRDGEARRVADAGLARSGGDIVPIEYTATPLRENGDVAGAVVVVRDVSEKRQMQAQLIQSSKLATLGEMATGVAHELNQPLSIIRMASSGATRRIRKGTATTEWLADKLDRIEQQTTRAADIINHMRVFGRRPSGDPAPIDPRAACDGMLRLIGQQLRQDQIETVIEFAETCPPVRGYAVLLEQVLLNLVSNARDAIRAAREHTGEERLGDRIVARVAPDDANETVEISIEDTAGGIPPEIAERIFEPFFTTKGVGEGTGLGLSISYGIVADMGGTIAVQNQERGARFTISLPRAGAPDEC